MKAAFRPGADMEQIIATLSEHWQWVEEALGSKAEEDLKDRGEKKHRNHRPIFLSVLVAIPIITKH